ncbi:hypothetical protein HHI36_016272 [Cryptolaemus montrouzieri]|uniref:tRNA synthetases class I catalytic domain-containing protein n=1 Tax=Cryptolaemus montrouzieri TaxID=559131 RepID=A0ABD2NJQ3_9CUCU
MDLKFPHHENEEAQSCAYHNCPQWVNYWIHIGQLNTKSSEKMSKSLKNTISIKALLKFSKPDDFRLACLMSHYRSRMEFSEELLNTAKRTLKKYRNFLSSCELYILKNTEEISDDGSLKYLLLQSNEKLHQAFCDDFDTPEVINILNRIIKSTNPLLISNSISTSTVISLRNFIQQILHLFNISECENMDIAREPVDEEVLDILKDFRQNIRELGLATKNKDILKCCDEVRSKLQCKGIDIKDFNKSKTHSV